MTNPSYAYAPKPQWTYVPAGGKIDLSIAMFPCDRRIGNLGQADVTATLIVKIEDKTFELAITAQAVATQFNR